MSGCGVIRWVIVGCIVVNESTRVRGGMVVDWVIGRQRMKLHFGRVKNMVV